MNEEPTPGHFAHGINLFAAFGAEDILVVRVQPATLGPADSNCHLRHRAIL
jgi:hypothetical protein